MNDEHDIDQWQRMVSLGEGDLASVATVSYDRERAKARKEAADRLRREADRYEKDGEPGELSSCWGWRTIAEHLRKIANDIEKAS